MKIKVNKLKEIISEEILKENQIILEYIDEKSLGRIDASLEKLENLARKYRLLELEMGIEKASKLVSKTINNFGSVRGLIASKIEPGGIKDRLTGLTAVNSLEVALASGLKSLPKIISIVQRGAIKEQPETSIKDFQSANKIRKLFKSSFRPPGFLALFRGMPFIDDDKFIEDLMELDVEQLTELSQEAQSLGATRIPISKDDAEKMAQLSQAKPELISKMKFADQEKPPSIPKQKLSKRTLYSFLKKNTSIEDDEVIQLINFLTKKGISIY